MKMSGDGLDLYLHTSRTVDVPGHTNWIACIDGHIYQRDGVPVREYVKERGERRMRVHCKECRCYHYVARLVAESFRGPAVVGKSVVHRNGDPSDNRLCNLKFAEEAGTNSHSGKTHRLSEFELTELHRRIDAGDPHTVIAAGFGVSPRTVRNHAGKCCCSSAIRDGGFAQMSLMDMEQD